MATKKIKLFSGNFHLFFGEHAGEWDYPEGLYPNIWVSCANPDTAEWEDYYGHLAINPEVNEKGRFHMDYAIDVASQRMTPEGSQKRMVCSNFLKAERGLEARGVVAKTNPLDPGFPRAPGDLRLVTTHRHGNSHTFFMTLEYLNAEPHRSLGPRGPGDWTFPTTPWWRDPDDAHIPILTGPASNKAGLQELMEAVLDSARFGVDTVKAEITMAEFVEFGESPKATTLAEKRFD